MFRIIALTLVAIPAWAGPFGFSIEEHRDDFTGTTYIVGDGLKVCPPKGITSCASLRIAWTQEDPDTALLRIEVHNATSILALSAKTPDGIVTFDADTITDIDAARVPSGLTWSSANTFAVPIQVLESIAASRETGTIRVTGTHSSIDFDFYRKAKARGVPADELRKFLEYISKSSPAPAPAE
jgi:hypothetical protein